MAFRVGGVEVFSDDGALSRQAITAARDGSSADITGTDQLILFDGDGAGDVMRVSVDELGSKYNAVAPGGLQYTFSENTAAGLAAPGQVRLNVAQNTLGIHQDDRNGVLQSAFFGSLAPLTYVIYVSFDGGAGFFQGTYTDSTPDVFRFSSGTYAGVVPPDGANIEVTISPSSTVGDVLELNRIVPLDNNVFEITNQDQSQYALKTNLNNLNLGRPVTTMNAVEINGPFIKCANDVGTETAIEYAFAFSGTAPADTNFPIPLDFPSRDTNFPSIDKFSMFDVYFSMADSDSSTYVYGWRMVFNRNDNRFTVADLVTNVRQSTGSFSFPYDPSLTGQAQLGPFTLAPAGGGPQLLAAGMEFVPDAIGATFAQVRMINTDATFDKVYNLNVRFVATLFPNVP